jgi:hypothetical protein
VTLAHYVQRVLDEYLSLPDTPSRPRKPDRALALKLYAQDVDLETVIAALRLATLRRHERNVSVPALEPVRSLYYFVPVIKELQRPDSDPSYLTYVNNRYEDIFQNEAPAQNQTGCRRALHQLRAVSDRR